VQEITMCKNILEEKRYVRSKFPGVTGGLEGTLQMLRL